MARKTQKQKAESANVNVLDLGKSLGLTVLGDSTWATVDDWLPTFLPELDKILGGGIPFGRLTEVMGKNQSGKSTLMINLLRSAIKLDVLPVMIDSEGTANPEFLQSRGVDVTKVFLVQPSESKDGSVSSNQTLTVEEVGRKVEDIITAFSPTGKRILLIWDSIAQTPAMQEIEKGVENKQPGIKSKALAQMINIVAPLVSKSNCAFVAVNQARDEMGSMFGGVDSPGGHALKHWASIRLEVNKSTAIKQKVPSGLPGVPDKEEYVGHMLRCKTIKSKVTTPQRTSISYLLGGNLDYEENIFYSSKERYGLISSRGWKTYVSDSGEEIKFQKDSDWVNYLKSEEGAHIRKELFQKQILAMFPDGYAPLNNTSVNVLLWEDLEGIEKRYEDAKEEEALEPSDDIADVIDSLD